MGYSRKNQVRRTQIAGLWAFFGALFFLPLHANEQCPVEFGALASAGNASPPVILPPEIAARARELAQYTDDATKQYVRYFESIGAARLETHLKGRKLMPGTSPNVDWVDREYGNISLKGPVVAKISEPPAEETVQLYPKFDPKYYEKSLVTDLSQRSGTQVLVVDTLGMSAEYIRTLRQKISAMENTYQKKIFFLVDDRLEILSPTPR